MEQRRASVHALLWLLPLAALVLSGSSILKLSYDHLAALVQWKIDAYVDLDDTQKQRLHTWALQRQPTAALQLQISRAWTARLTSADGTSTNMIVPTWVTCSTTSAPT